MARGTIAQYLCIPAVIALGAVLLGLRQEPFTWEMFLSAGVGGFLYYTAPFLIWALVVSVADFSGPVAHSGFIAASVALIAITVLSLLGRDPSGLPIQWLIYWPFAIALQALSVTAAALYVRWRSRVGA